MSGPRACPVCGDHVAGTRALAAHLFERAEQSDGRHVMWLNRRVTKRRVPVGELEHLLREALGGGTPEADRVRR